MKEPKEFDFFKAWLLFFLIATVGGALFASCLAAILLLSTGMVECHSLKWIVLSRFAALCWDSDFLRHLSCFRWEISFPRIEDHGRKESNQSMKPFSPIAK